MMNTYSVFILVVLYEMNILVSIVHVVRNKDTCFVSVLSVVLSWTCVHFVINSCVFIHARI